MKCRTKREMQDTKAVTMENGKPATQGTCPVCGTKIFRIGKGLIDVMASRPTELGWIASQARVYEASRYHILKGEWRYEDGFSSIRY